jgi:peptidoglycan hydrolase-like protein with peptidoglycan-binding domain
MLQINNNQNNENEQTIIPGGPSKIFTYLPENITVHLGQPDEDSENVTIPFIDYIKNVASNELYPTWSENALRANIHAIVSVALNRAVLQWYRIKGYDFDITNSTQYDQAYVHNSGIFDNISNITNEIFNQYIVKRNDIIPFYAEFCDGKISQCNGMYQWGAVYLADEGYDAIEILKYYYGDDISIVKDAPVGLSGLSFIGEPMKLGDSRILVLMMQLALNRIYKSFPAVPKITPIDGYFGQSTESAVKEFQKIFGLPVTGIIDQETFYKIRYIYLAVAKTSELTAEQTQLANIIELTKNSLLQGDKRPQVTLLQFFLNILSLYYNTIPGVTITGIFDPETRTSVIEFQKTMGLPVTGIVNPENWDIIYKIILTIFETLPVETVYLPYIPYADREYIKGFGIEQPGVFAIQVMLASISLFMPSIPLVNVNGMFDEETERAVIAFQNLYGIEPTGTVNETTWNELMRVYQQQSFRNMEQ